MTKRLPKYHRLLNQLKRRPMTYTQIKEFLARDTGVVTNLHDPSLYGTSYRQGIFERFCVKDVAGRYYVPDYVHVSAPYTPVRDYYY